jgi:hypothetical protein
MEEGGRFARKVAFQEAGAEVRRQVHVFGDKYGLLAAPTLPRGNQPFA